MPKRLGVLAAAVLALSASRASAAPIKSEVTRAPLRRGAAVAPLPKEKASHSHAPYESGQCGVCHVNNEPSNPGPIRHSSVNEECFECHDDVREIMA
ncbi:MAG TPA: cytochrome c3 family protein, partial [Anaeromyxobacter sp.]